jgi:hypothetical protein
MNAPKFCGDKDEFARWDFAGFALAFIENRNSRLGKTLAGKIAEEKRAICDNAQAKLIEPCRGNPWRLRLTA